MAESQNIEYKEIWKDEYLKWLCGFANAQGGTLFVGIDDNGNVVGIKNIKKLLDDLPNKINSGLGIIAQINTLTKDSVDYLEIKVEKSASPVSYQGVFFLRSGTTNQKLTGSNLVDFISRKTGVIWEDGVVDNISVDDLDDESFKIFRREALKKKRIAEDDLNLSNEELLEKLDLIVNGKLTRTAILLFYKSPSVIKAGTMVQVGKFYDGPEILYQDTFDGSLISIADKIIDIIYLKYLKAKITFEHDRRYEVYPFARDAVREAIFNAIVHNCYRFGAPIQIRIDDEQMMISNCCVLPSDWTADELLKRHNSRPYNATLANVFYIAGYIEHCGRGIEKIFTACKKLGAEPPVYRIVGNDISLTFRALESAVIEDPSETSTKSASLEVDESNSLDNLLEQRIISEIKVEPSISQTRLAEITGTSVRTIKREIKKLVDSGHIERTEGKRYGKWIVLK